MSGKKTGKTRRMGSSRKERQGLGRMSHYEDLEAMEEESQAGVEKQDVGRRQVEDSTYASLESRVPYRESSPSNDLLSTDQLHLSHSAVQIGLKFDPLSVAPESRTSGFGEQALDSTMGIFLQSQTEWPPNLQSTTPPPRSVTTEENVITAKITQADVTQAELPTHEDNRSTYPTTVLNTRVPEDLSNPETHGIERRRKMGSSRRSSNKSDMWRRGGVEWDVADSYGKDHRQEKTEKKVIETSKKLQEEKVPKWITTRAEGLYGHGEEGKEEPALVEDMHAEQPSCITERQIPVPYSEFQAQSMYTELDWHSSPSHADFESNLTGNPDHLKDRMLDSDPPGGAVLIRNPQLTLFGEESGDHINPVLQHHQPSHRCLPDEKGHAVGGFEQKKRRMASTRKIGCSLHKEKDIGAELGDFSEQVLPDLNEILRASRGLQDIGNIEDSEKYTETDMRLIMNIDTAVGNEREMPSSEEDNDIKETKDESPAEEDETKEIKQEGLGESQVLKDEGPLEYNAMRENKEEDLVDNVTHELKEEGGLVEQNKTLKLIKESLVEENDIQVLKKEGLKEDDEIQIIMGQGGEQNNQSVKRDKDILDQDVLEDEETSKAGLERKEKKEGDAEEVKVLNEKVSVKLFGGQAESIKDDQSLLGSFSVDGYQEENKSEEKDSRSLVIHQAQGETLTAIPEIKISPLFKPTAAQNLEQTLNFDHTLDNHSANIGRTSPGNEPISPTSEPPCTENFIMEDRQPTPGKRRKIGCTQKNTRRKGDQVEEDGPENATQHEDDEGGLKKEVRNEELDEHTGVEVMTELYREEVQLDKQLIKKEKEEEDPENIPKMSHKGEVIIKEEIDVSSEKTVTFSCEIFGLQATEHSLDACSLTSFQRKAEKPVTIQEASTNIMLEESSKILVDISDRECSGMKKRRKMGSSRRGGREEKKWQEDRRHLEHADTEVNSQDKGGAESTMEVRENIVEAETERTEENVKLAMATMVVVSSECRPNTLEKVEEKWEKSGEEECGSLESSGPTFTENKKDTDVNSLITCQGLIDNSTAAGSSTSNLPVLQSSQQHEDSSPQVTSSMGKRRKMGSSRKGAKEWHKEQESENKTVSAEEHRKAKKDEFAKEGYMTEVLILTKEEQQGEVRAEERNLMEKSTLSVRSIPNTMTSQMVESAAMTGQPELPNLQGTDVQAVRRRKMGSSRKDKINLGKGERGLECTKDTATAEDPNVAAVLRRIQEVFSHSTFKDKQFITLQDIQDLSSELGPCVEELQQVFQQLDQNLRGLVTPEDFETGLREFFQLKACPPNLIHQSQASVGLVEMDHTPRQYFPPDLEHPGGHSFQQGPAGPLGYSILGWTTSGGTLLTEENPVPRVVSLSQASNHWQEGQALWDKKADKANNEETGSFSDWSPPASGPDLLYNVVLVGNSSVGKTSFMKRLQSGEVSLDHCATIGLDSCIQAIMIDGQRVLLQLWDTAGQERYHSITKQILRKAQGLLLMYDITSSQSFSGLRYWMSCAEEGAPDDVVTMLLGNKNDSPQREVPRDEGEKLAAEFNIPFMECSAASGDNITNSMETLARMLKHRLDQKDEPPLLLHKEQPKKRFGCC
ncbi:uncharacterized protein LOC108931245 isoform X1 [Scleropages formosus]|uniref:Uncharacterized LOC108931245 n=1 Tax=Scleropages formosus TaxID=113540 RepID=A0A8C9V8J9_SCLFO|nr:uncharacterized protein LOC108931245 isoform X1 [Scleropages formosus]